MINGTEDFILTETETPFCARLTITGNSPGTSPSLSSLLVHSGVMNGNSPLHNRRVVLPAAVEG